MIITTVCKFLGHSSCQRVDSDPPLLWYGLVLVSPFQWWQCEDHDPPCLPTLDHKRAYSLRLAGSSDSCSRTEPPCCKEAQATWKDLSMCLSPFVLCILSSLSHVEENSLQSSWKVLEILGKIFSLQRHWGSFVRYTVSIVDNSCWWQH